MYPCVKDKEAYCGAVERSAFRLTANEIPRSLLRGIKAKGKTRIGATSHERLCGCYAHIHLYMIEIKAVASYGKIQPQRLKQI